MLVPLAWHVGKWRATLSERFQPDAGGRRPHHHLLYRESLLFRLVKRRSVGLQPVHRRRRGQSTHEKHSRRDTVSRSLSHRGPLRHWRLQLCALRLLVRLLPHVLMGSVLHDRQPLVPACKPLGGECDRLRATRGRHLRQGPTRSAAFAAAALAAAAAAPSSVHDERAY